MQLSEMRVTNRMCKMFSCQCVAPLSPRHLDLALEREDNPCSAFWLGVPGAQSPHLRAVASCLDN